MNDCVICKKHQKNDFPRIYESESVIVCHHPVVSEEIGAYQGHLFVETKRHITSFAEFSDQEAAELGVIYKKATVLLESELGAEHVYSYRIGHLAPHLHFHLVPRYRNTPEQFWDRELHNWPEAPRITQNEIRALSEKLLVLFNAN